MQNKTKWIVNTALMLALLIVLQVATKSFGQIVTGSCVNFVLLFTSLQSGLASGAVVALVSPFAAFMLGIGPAFLPIVPCIAAGNFVLVLVAAVLKNKLQFGHKNLSMYAGALAAAFAKFAVLYLTVVKIAIPALGLPQEKAAVLAATFSWPQLVTALIGSAVACTLLSHPAFSRK